MAERLTTSVNRQMAHVQPRALRRRGDRWSLAISMFAFFATIFTLGWFVLVNWQGVQGPVEPIPTVAVAETAVAAELAPTAEATIAADQAAAQTDDFPEDELGVEMDPEAEEDVFFNFGDPMVDWFTEEVGGWGEPQYRGRN